MQCKAIMKSTQIKGAIMQLW